MLPTLLGLAAGVPPRTAGSMQLPTPIKAELSRVVILCAPNRGPQDSSGGVPDIKYAEVFLKIQTC